MADPRIKLLRIKTGVVKRLTKEKESYEKEVVQMEEKLEKMKTEGRDEHDIRKQVEVTQDTRQMVPHTQRSLQKACSELTELLEKEPDLQETEEYNEAKKILKTAEPQL